MSLAPSSPDVPLESQENEQLPWTAILLSAAGALGLFALGIAFALWLLNDVTGTLSDRQGDLERTQVGAVQVGIVEQRIVELETRAQKSRAQADARLSSYGWVDRESQLIHVPIEDAMRSVAEGQR